MIHGQAFNRFKIRTPRLWGYSLQIEVVGKSLLAIVFHNNISLCLSTAEMAVVDEILYRKGRLIFNGFGSKVKGKADLPFLRGRELLLGLFRGAV